MYYVQMYHRVSFNLNYDHCLYSPSPLKIGVPYLNHVTMDDNDWMANLLIATKKTAI